MKNPKKYKKQKIAIKDIPNIPPRGFVFIVPGPTNHLGEFFEISNNPLFVINHKPTSPPCNPTHPHKDFLSFNLIRDNKIPSKNNPISMLSICKKGKSNPIWTMLKINACPSIAFFNPNCFFNSSKSHPLKISSSANPTKNIKNIEFKNVSKDILPTHIPHSVPIIEIKIRHH